MSKKISCLMLTFIILLTSFSSIFAQNNEEITNPVREPYNEVLVDQNVIDLLEREQIEYVITESNIIQLNNPNLKEISRLNSKLKSEFTDDVNKSTLSANSVSQKSGYPTQWHHVNIWDRRTNKHFIKATKSALAAGITSWIFGWATSAKEIGQRAAAQFGTYYFVNGTKENIYYSTMHYYRTLGPGYFDSNGNHIGDYELKRVDRTTKSSDHTGGQSTTKYQKSTMVITIQ